MTDLWEQTREMAEKHANKGSVFIRLANHEDKAVGVFCGDPYGRMMHWLGDKYEECSENGCPHCANGKRNSLRVMVNFFQIKDGEMKIMEGNGAWYNDLYKVKEKYGTDKWVFEVERHGESGDPKTSYSILPEKEIDDGIRARMQAVELHDLPSYGRGEHKDDTPTKNKTPGERIDPRALGEFVALLKTLPDSDVDAFLAEFKVQRVRDIHEEDEHRAREYLKGIVVSQEKPSIDPFA